MSPRIDDLRGHLRRYGARPEDIVVLDEPVVTLAEKAVDVEGMLPEQHFRYLDLIRPATNDIGTLRPRAIVEVDGQPILYVVDHLKGRTPFSKDAMVRLRRTLAFRADADHVAIIEPGRLTVYPLPPSDGSMEPRLLVPDREAAGLIPSLAFAPEPRDPKSDTSAAAVHWLLYRLLTATAAEIRARGVDKLDALSLVGRALFVRFLRDRRILKDSDLAEVCPSVRRYEDCFNDAGAAAQTSHWIDTEFNGDFLPLPRHGDVTWFRSLDKEVFRQLSMIVLRTDWHGQLHIDWGDRWNDLLFDRIPVGLLSQVYENFAHNDDPERARREGVYYTPRLIAEYMVDEAFSALGERAHAARVLDPAAGGGVFLVAAFRRIAAEHWLATGHPPGTDDLRRILDTQLTGFDVNEDALRLCSLALYLTAMEFDPRPQIGRLKFKPLLGRVLNNVNDAQYPRLGSLGPHISADFKKQYDVVIGNPPWTAWEKGDLSDEAFNAQVESVENVVGSIVKVRLGQRATGRYEMVDKVPDLPFFWRATEWAKDSGWIAFAMHGRLLFKESRAGKRARDDLFRGVRVVGVLNCTAVCETAVWPNMIQQFCLVFAQNRPSSDDDVIYFASPDREDNLNQHGRMRIDFASAEPVTTSSVLRRPSLLKTLFLGTQLDASVLDQIMASAPRSLQDYWKRRWKEKRSGEGFQVKGGDDNPVGDMAKMKMLSRGLETPYLLNTAKMPYLPYKTLHRPRSIELYRAPLVIVDKRPSAERTSDQSSAYLATEDVAFNKTFTGFSCKAHEDPQALARYLLLLLNSSMPLYVTLLTSSQYGVERRVLLIQDIKRLPFRPLEELPAELKDQIYDLSMDLIRDPEATFDRLDAWVGQVYGLSKSDREVIRDTLEVTLPYAKNRDRAQAPPQGEELDRFVERMRKILTAFVDPYERHVSVRVLRYQPGEHWIVLQVDSHVESRPPPMLLDSAMPTLLDEADSLAATQVISVHPPFTLLVALVSEYKYFTPSRARLVALGLLQDHEATLIGKDKADEEEVYDAFIG